ncbi:MAG: hypothetical protein WCZ01_03135, partial [Candidatus Neomarinimicrobiota bacterium]
MKKVVLFVHTPERDSALKKLRKLGVVHIQHIKQPISEDTSKIENAIYAVEKSLGIIEGYNTPPSSENVDLEKCQKLVSDIIALETEKQNLKSKIDEKNIYLNWYNRWGIISEKDVAELKEHRIYLHLYVIDRSILKNIPEEAAVEILKEEKNQLLIA